MRTFVRAYVCVCACVWVDGFVLARVRMCVLACIDVIFCKISYQIRPFAFVCSSVAQALKG